MSIKKTAFPQSWTIIVVCFNEIDLLPAQLDRITRWMKGKELVDSELILVDDGSEDGSAQFIQEFGLRNPNVKTILHTQNKGIGQALRSGYKLAEKDWITVLPGDGEFRPDEFDKVDSWSKNEFISFCRSGVHYNSSYRVFLSRFNKWFNRIFLGIRMRDVNWVKVFPGLEFRKLDLQLESILIETEICSKLIKSGLKLKELPSEYHFRGDLGESKGGALKVVFKALVELVKLVWVVNNFRKE